MIMHSSNHRYWKILNLNDNKDLFFVKVEGKKFCKSTKENILPKSDVFIAKMNNQGQWKWAKRSRS